MRSAPFSFCMLVFFVASLVATQTNAECTCTDDVAPSMAFYQDFVDANTRTVQTNGIPSHEYHIGRERANSHSVCLQPSQVELPASPIFDDYKDSPMGVIGVLKTGGFVYNHKSSTDGADDVANHPDNEQKGLDICHGHADAKCTYHYHEISQLQECTHDGQWDTCELIGYILDGFPIYSHCFFAEKNRYLQSCYSITNDTDQDNGGDTSDYSHIASENCDLDAANGFDFTGKGILDSEGNEITGYAYVASDTYPYVMPKYAGSTWNRLSDLNVAFTTAPSSTPSFEPTLAPSSEESLDSTRIPSAMPSLAPSVIDDDSTPKPTTAQPTARPTLPADQTPKPTTTRRPTKLPTPTPTQLPTNPATAQPTLRADQTPKPSMTRRPTKLPTPAPTAPTALPTKIAQDPSTSSPTIHGDNTPRPTPKRTTSTPTKASKTSKSEKKRPKLPKSKNTRAPTPERVTFQPSMAPSNTPVSALSGLLASIGGAAATLLTCGMGS